MNVDIVRMIDGIDWENYATIYGRADGTPDKDGRSCDVPKLLCELFSEVEVTAIDAADVLFDVLCSKPNHIASAALPAYDIMMYCFRNAGDKLRNVLIEIFFTVTQRAAENMSDDDIHIKLLQKLEADVGYFKMLTHDPNSDIAECAAEICEMLERSSNVSI